MSRSRVPPPKERKETSEPFCFEGVLVDLFSNGWRFLLSGNRENLSMENPRSRQSDLHDDLQTKWELEESKLKKWMSEAGKK